MQFQYAIQLGSNFFAIYKETLNGGFNAPA
jgi:hypothetical protein